MCAPKSCELDPIPTSLVLECLDTVLSNMTSIINDSLTSGILPSSYKSAIVTPLLKKPSLDLTYLDPTAAYSMCLVFKALCYLGLDLISLKDSKLFQLKVLILSKLSCVVVFLRALF